MKVKIVKQNKPECKLVGTDGNVFAVIGAVCASLRRSGSPDKADKFRMKATSCNSYDEVLRLVHEYVEVK